MQKSNESLGVWSIHLSNNPSICVCNTWIIIRDMNGVGHPKKQNTNINSSRDTCNTAVHYTASQTHSCTCGTWHKCLISSHCIKAETVLILSYQILWQHTAGATDAGDFFILFLHPFQSYCNKLFIYSTWLSTVLSQTLQINELFKK